MGGIHLVGPPFNYSARVNTNGKLETLSTVLDVAAATNYNDELSFTLTDTIVPDSTAVDFLYIKNGSDRPLVIVATEFWCANDETIKLYRNPSGSPTGGSTITPQNCNFGSNRQGPGTFYYGTSLGGLSGGGLRNIIRLQSNVSRRYTFDDWTLMPRNTSIRFYAEYGQSELDFWVQFFYLPQVF